MDKITLLGIPFDFGQDNVGVRLALNFLKQRGLLSQLSKICPVKNYGELRFPFKANEKVKKNIKQKRSCSGINSLISDYICSMDLNSSFLLNIGGDHGLGLGSVHGMLLHNPETVVVWADAHGDINTPESSPSGNFHGMPLAFLLGLAKDEEFSWLSRHLIPQNLIFFGPRDLDPAEISIIRKLGIQYFSSEEINQSGGDVLINNALNIADPLGTKPIHLSFDVDLFDSEDISSTGTRVSAGPRHEEVLKMGRALAESGRLRSMDLVEFNPLIGTDEEVNSSCDLILKFLEATLKNVFTESSERNGFLAAAFNLGVQELSSNVG